MVARRPVLAITTGTFASGTILPEAAVRIGRASYVRRTMPTAAATTFVPAATTAFTTILAPVTPGIPAGTLAAIITLETIRTVVAARTISAEVPALAATGIEASLAGIATVTVAEISGALSIGASITAATLITASTFAAELCSTATRRVTALAVVCLFSVTASATGLFAGRVAALAVVAGEAVIPTRFTSLTTLIRITWTRIISSIGARTASGIPFVAITAIKIAGALPVPVETGITLFPKTTATTVISGFSSARTIIPTVTGTISATVATCWAALASELIAGSEFSTPGFGTISVATTVFAVTAFSTVTMTGSAEFLCLLAIASFAGDLLCAGLLALRVYAVLLVLSTSLLGALDGATFCLWHVHSVLNRPLNQVARQTHPIMNIFCELPNFAAKGDSNAN